jgi:hypothetical protein
MRNKINIDFWLHFSAAIPNNEDKFHKSGRNDKLKHLKSSK